RCKMEVPMLDEDEFAVVNELFSSAFGMTKEFRLEHNLPFNECPIDERFRPVREAYEQMTGVFESNHNVIMHHRISLYGEPCENCGKPLRTPQAAFCAACGKTVDLISTESTV
ncbi:MAG TPA: hypothetical protein VK308_02640, partial [Pyrinomonadaceae bacterium]|nr:hypothetical protein [Pyrinomonadaceae bacterium]